MKILNLMRQAYWVIMFMNAVYKLIVIMTHLIGLANNYYVQQDTLHTHAATKLD